MSLAWLKSQTLGGHLVDPLHLLATHSGCSKLLHNVQQLLGTLGRTSSNALQFQPRNLNQSLVQCLVLDTGQAECKGRIGSWPTAIVGTQGDLQSLMNRVDNALHM